jgi:hypothetical protein
MCIEDFEEFALGGHESTEHENPGKWVNMGLTSNRHIVPLQDSRRTAPAVALLHVNRIPGAH